MHFRPFEVILEHVFFNFFMKKKSSKIFHTFFRRGGIFSNSTQVPKTSVNLDGDVHEKFMCSPSLLTQGSWEWWVSQISTSRILHSGQNFR